MDPANFVTTLELVPARESRGMRIDTLKGIARDAFADGRISAVSITDNPGGNPSLSPDVLGYEIFKLGLDVIVHFTCRDMNRVGMESRALQLARMGMKNILALTGDYSGKGFGGQGKPVFDFDSVILTDMLQQLTQRLYKGGEPDGFFTGCAVSPFKYTKAEALVQYQKLDNKLSAGAGFVITQLGYDVEKFTELMMVLGQRGKIPPVMGSVYLLSPRSARAMNRGRVPGAHIGDALLTRVLEDWRNKPAGLKKSIERAAVLGAVLKGLGFRGIHIGGIHRSFKTVGAILDRMEEIQDSWQEHLEELSLETRPGGYYQFGNQAEVSPTPSLATVIKNRLQDRYPYTILKKTHQCFFAKESAFSPFYKKIAQTIDTANKAWLVKTILEDPFKKMFLS
ncbi:MAG TPA: methylenetetrahydrofolate reductase, partial [Desulfobacteraceae bacterium]|nr:methylenetetrahydrofolate reductase [Desulfobacteraceae bacterium]